MYYGRLTFPLSSQYLPYQWPVDDVPREAATNDPVAPPLPVRPWLTAHTLNHRHCLVVDAVQLTAGFVALLWENDISAGTVTAIQTKPTHLFWTLLVPVKKTVQTTPWEQPIFLRETERDIQIL